MKRTPLKRRTPMKRGGPMKRSAITRTVSLKRSRIVPTTKPRDWSQARLKVAAEGRCRVCLSAEKLEAAHTIGRKYDKADERGVFMVDQRDIVPLCQTCHIVQELADAVGTDAASIEAVERTSVTHTTAPCVARFAAALGVHPSDIAERR